jgi:predicted nucleic acid-binding protein
LVKIEAVESTPAPAPAYFDSALIAKFYLNEAGRESIRALAKRAGLVVSSGIAVAEVSAAFHRKLREKAIDRYTFKALQGQFQHDLAGGLWSLVSPTEALLEEVRTFFSRLDESVFLRSLDALHLVTAKAERFNIIYSNDRHLLAACGAAGLEGVNPLADPRQELTSQAKVQTRKKTPAPKKPRL